MINGREYEIIANVKDALDSEMLKEKYDPYLDQYDYLVGDVSSEHLRLKGFYDDSNTLYRKPGYDQYLLVICKGHHTPEEFNKVCNILAEYGVQKKYTHATEAYFMEHYDMLIDDHALQILAKI